MGGILGEIRDIRRTVQEVGRTAQSVARAGADITGADDTFRSQDARYRTRSYNDRYRADVAEDRYRDYRDQRDDRDDDRRRGDFASGRGGQGPRGFASGQPRDDGRGGAGQGQDVDARLGQDFVDAVRAANQGSALAREEALEIAKQFTQNDRTALPSGIYDVGSNEPLTVGSRSVYNSPEEAVTALSAYLASKNHGKAFTMAPVTETVTVGTGTSTPAPDAPPAPDPATAKPDAPAPGTAKPGASGVASFALPEASGPAAKIYTKNGEGRTMKAEDAPKISASQVKAIQQKLDVKDDGMWGPNTQAAFAAAAAKAGVTPSDVDFTNPNDPETIKIMAHFNAGASPAAGAAVTAAPAAATEAERLTTAAAHLTQLAGENKTLTADDIAVMGQDKAAVETTAKTFDLNGNGSVEQTELDKIVAAANGVDIRGGAATLAPMFAGVTVPATAVAETIEYVSNPVVQPLQAAKPAQQAATDTQDSGEIVLPISKEHDRQAKVDYIAEELAALDTNGDKKVTREELAAFEMPKGEGVAPAVVNSEKSGAEGFLAHLDANLKFGATASAEDKQAVYADALKQSGLSVDASAAETNPLFAAASFAPVTPAVEGKTASQQAEPVLQNAVYTVEPIEPSSKGVPFAQGFDKGGSQYIA